MAARSRKSSKRAPHSLIALIESLLSETVEIVDGGQRRRIDKFEAIIRKLMVKETAGDDRAATLLLSYQRYASRGARRRTQLVFVDSPYTKAFANYPRKASDER